MKKRSKYKLTIETAQIITPSAKEGIYSSKGNKSAKLRIGRNGTIAGWDRDSALNSDRQIGFQNCIVGPGFIDIHFHGYGEQSNMPYSEIGSFQNPERILEKITSYGTTAAIATMLVPAHSRRFFGVDLDARFKLLRSQLADLTMKDASPDKTRARLLGIHLEGPKINPAVSGAIPPNTIWDANIRDLPRIIGEDEKINSNHGVRIVTVAPEMDISSDFSFIRALVDCGIIVSLGHSAATLEQTIAAINAGARHLTHLYNSMKQFTHRDPSIIGAGLIDPRFYNAHELGLSLEIICDFIHVNPAILTLAVNQHHLVASVTDSVANPDMEDGTYEFAGQWVSVFENAVRVLNDGRLSGSSLTMLQAFRNLLLLGGDEPDIVKAFEITATAPAKILGLNDSGKIEKGKRADLVILDSDYNLLYTIVNGEIAYEAPKVLKQRDTVPISLTSKGKVSKPVEDEAFIGLRISPYSLWCGYVADGETVHVTTKDENGNPRHKQGYAGREAILDSAAASLFEAWKNLQSNDLKLTALGIVTSGLVDGTKAVMAMNLPEWKDFDITGELVKRVRRLDRSFPEDIFVAVENSANAMTMAIARTRRLRELTEITEDENFIFIQTGSALGTGVFINGHPISCIKDIAPDYYVHLRQAIENVHMGLPTFLHQTVLINRLIARGELALMRKCDDEYPELHLEALVSLDGMIHYAREEEKREGKIIFRKEKVKKIIDALKRDPYSYENTAFELELTNKDILDALDGEKDAAEHAEKVFMRMGMALGSGIYSLTNNLNTQIRHVVILPQMVEDFSKAAMIMKKGIITSLTSSKNDKKGWKVTFMDIDDELFVIAGASVCCE